MSLLIFLLRVSSNSIPSSPSEMPPIPHQRRTIAFVFLATPFFSTLLSSTSFLSPSVLLTCWYAKQRDPWLFFPSKRNDSSSSAPDRPPQCKTNNAAGDGCEVDEWWSERSGSCGRTPAQARIAISGGVRDEAPDRGAPTHPLRLDSTPSALWRPHLAVRFMRQAAIAVAGSCPRTVPHMPRACLPHMVP